MIIELPAHFKARLPLFNQRASKVFTKQAFKELLLCLIIAGIGILGTYYLIHTDRGIHHLTTIENTNNQGTIAK